MESERPRKLSELELEEYNLMLEEQAYPFEEKGISIHKKNIELLNAGVYSQWIDRSLRKLGELVPGRYAKYEVSSGVVTSLMSYRYALDGSSERSSLAALPKATDTVKNAPKSKENSTKN